MATIERQNQTIDVSGKSLGRVSTEIAHILMGKHKPSYVPHHDHGDIVYIENVDKLNINPKKAENKKYYSYSGFPGGLKEKTQKEVFENDPGEVLRRTVFQMLPDNKLRNNRMKRLIIK